MSTEVRIGQGGRGRAQGDGGERPMGTAACVGKGFKGRAVVSGDRPIGAASCRHQHTQVSCQTPHSSVCHPQPRLCNRHLFRPIEGPGAPSAALLLVRRSFLWCRARSSSCTATRPSAARDSQTGASGRSPQSLAVAAPLLCRFLCTAEAGPGPRFWAGGPKEADRSGGSGSRPNSTADADGAGGSTRASSTNMG